MACKSAAKEKNHHIVRHHGYVRRSENFSGNMSSPIVHLVVSCDTILLMLRQFAVVTNRPVASSPSAF
jgi:hypothetical protein